MAVELLVLTLLMLLAASMWVPHIVGVNTAPAGSLPDDAPDGFVRITDVRVHRDWVGRAHRAHMNLLEQAVPFAVLVLILDRMGGFTTLTAWTAWVFLALRLTHAIGDITATTRFPGRPLIFTAGWVCCVIMGIAIFLAP